MHSLTYIATEAYMAIENRILNEYKQLDYTPTADELDEKINTVIDVLNEVRSDYQSVINLKNLIEGRTTFYTHGGEEILVTEDNE